MVTENEIVTTAELLLLDLLGDPQEEELESRLLSILRIPFANFKQAYRFCLNAKT